MINTTKLDGELKAAGIPILGCDSSGRVIDTDGKEIQSRADVAVIIAAHDPTPEPESETIRFPKPLVAPDFIVQSPKPKTDPLEALLEAITESKKGDKSIALIVLDLVVSMEELEKRIKTLEKK